MEEDNRISTEEVKRFLVLMFLLITIAGMALYIRAVDDKLKALEQATKQESISQQDQIESLSLYIEDVKGEMTEGFEKQQEQLDSQQEEISRQKQVQRSTNQALTSFRKQQKQVEEELREELKKD